jgi:hypothetical protein
MRDAEDFRLVVFKMAQAAQPEKQRLFRFRETLDTTILGTLSTSIGLVVLFIGLSGLLGFHHREWHDLLGKAVVPSFVFRVATIVGEGLGLAGLALGWMKGGTIPPLAAAGTIVGVIQIYLFFGQILLTRLSGSG